MQSISLKRTKEKSYFRSLEQDLCFKSRKQEKKRKKIIIKIFFSATLTFIQFEWVPNEFQIVHVRSRKSILSSPCFSWFVCNGH